MSSTKILLSIVNVFFLSSCGSAAKREPCPTVAVEPVSTCRAIEKCREQRSSYGVGVGVGVSPNVGIGISQSQSSENYTNCIDRDLKDQESQVESQKRGVSSEGKPGLEPGLVQ